MILKKKKKKTSFSSLCEVLSVKTWISGQILSGENIPIMVLVKEMDYTMLWRLTAAVKWTVSEIDLMFEPVLYEGKTLFMIIF